VVITDDGVTGGGLNYQLDRGDLFEIKVESTGRTGPIRIAELDLQRRLTFLTRQLCIRGVINRAGTYNVVFADDDGEAEVIFQLFSE